MLREIIEAWKSKGLLVEIFDRFQKMLSETEEMFEMTYQVMFNNADKDKLQEQMYDTDIFVNKAERRVRKQIIEHLAIQPDVDMPACLVLMSVVKDAERLGDYCKNLIEAFELMEDLPSDSNSYMKDFNTIHNNIKEQFGKTSKAISEHSEETAKEVIHQQVELGKHADELFSELAEDDLPTRRAVAYTLIIRYYKRISCHLANIATSVVVPVHKIDYYYEKENGDKKKYIK